MPAHNVNPAVASTSRSKRSGDQVEYSNNVCASNSYEYELNEDSVISVKSRIKSCIQFWKDTLSAYVFVKNTIEFGCVVSFIQSPSKAVLKHNGSALIHIIDFIYTAIDNLLSSVCIREVLEDSTYLVYPLTVSVNATGKKRSVLDLRHVSQLVEKQKGRMKQYAKKNKNMIKYDLKSGFHHIDTHPDFNKDFGLSWKYGEKFNVLPFGCRQQFMFLQKWSEC